MRINHSICVGKNLFGKLINRNMLVVKRSIWRSQVSYAPARAKWELTVYNLVATAVFILWGWSVVLMFLARNLYFLMLASGVLWVAVIVIFIAVMRVSLKHLGWNIKEGLKYDGQS